MVMLAAPGEKTVVEFENERFNGIQADVSEAALLKKQIFQFIASDNDFLRDLFADNLPAILGALNVAKAELGGPFTGMFAGDAEIGVQLIRPGYVKRTTATTEAVSNDWTFTFTTAGDYWLGYSTNNTTALNIDKRALILPMAVWWTQAGAPLTEEIYVQVGGTTYPVNVVRHGWLADNKSQIRAARNRPMIWKPKATVLVQTNQIAAGTDQQMVLVGLAFAKGDLMRTLTVGAPQT